MENNQIVIVAVGALVLIVVIKLLTRVAKLAVKLALVAGLVAAGYYLWNRFMAT